MKSIRFHEINEFASSFPRPRVPALPILSFESFKTDKKPKTVGSLFLSRKPHYASSGRMALAHVLRSIHVKEGDEVLVPSYHCGSMVEPIIWCKSTPIFYHITAQLKSNFIDIESKLTKNTKVLIITHYFGFQTPFDKLICLCKTHNIKIIEDCAHAFFGLSNSYLPGSEGDYAITSLKKFFPCTDGGIFISNNEELIQEKTTRLPLKIQLSTTLNLLESSTSYNRLPFIKPLFFLINIINNLRNHDNAINKRANSKNQNNNQFKWFNPRTYSMEPTIFTKWLVTGNRSETRQYLKRRENYIQLSRGLINITGGQPLFPELPEGIIPYMFPFLLNNPESSFFTLMKEGVPAWRWEELAHSDCKIAQNYRERLIHIPCHQELTTTEINWMVETIQDVLNRTAEKVQV
ncbi:MAG: hypothetical protein GY777_22355 [Candidatus Brocadiaceae bacterium]|nr:hypothetical protein [Candidatus Brocadiaceae bacterium]